MNTLIYIYIHVCVYIGFIIEFLDFCLFLIGLIHKDDGFGVEVGGGIYCNCENIFS